MAQGLGKLNWTALSGFKPLLDKVLLGKHALQEVNCEQATPFSYLKPQQAAAIKQLLSGRDVVALLPTGYGKSLIYELLPRIDNTSLVLLVSPLNALISQQLGKLAPYACRVSSFKDCFRVVIDHPEQFLETKFLDRLRAIASDRKVFIVIDEAHCIVTWGLSFRKQYGRLIHLRAMAPEAVTLVLTATATVETTEEIKRKLSLRSAVIIKGNSDRPNIKLIVRERDSNHGPEGVAASYSGVFQPLLDQLTTEQERFPKTIVYTRLKWCGQGVAAVLRDRKDGTPSPIKNLVAQYHSPATEEGKQKAAKAFEAGHARLLFATEAYSMGTDVADVRQIVHAGPPYSLETLYQGIGRAGRDGEPAEAILYYNASDIGPNVVHMSDQVRKYCTTEECRRKTLAKYFGFEQRDVSHLHDCCDICSKKCKCAACCTLPTSSVSTTKTPVYSALELYFECEGDAKLSVDLASSLCKCKTLAELTTFLQDKEIDPDYSENIILIMKGFKAISL